MHLTHMIHSKTGKCEAIPPTPSIQKALHRPFTVCLFKDHTQPLWCGSSNTPLGAWHIQQKYPQSVILKHGKPVQITPYYSRKNRFRISVTPAG